MSVEEGGVAASRSLFLDAVSWDSRASQRFLTKLSCSFAFSRSWAFFLRSAANCSVADVATDTLSDHADDRSGGQSSELPSSLAVLIRFFALRLADLALFRFGLVGLSSDVELCA